ncbi:hypothetical protein CLU83_3069 [Flavobacterium sp. 1]|uniref:hypothetical protein n=1 Tax=Flavobacterium sp. 1 TaxID=2035200 RepID=UPI000CC86EDA|nr:hypothetical protein [Flavobacterium sp. 1]PJJ09700.1 hypothetical protein CLU83_3069 [Flavobacterium sp. 1]
MTTTEKIERVITNFVKGGDNSDLVLLDKVLHNDFRVTNNGFMGSSGITIIDKKNIYQTSKRAFLVDCEE